VYLLGFHAYINEMHGSRSKIPVKKISSSSVAQRDLILVLKGYSILVVGQCIFRSTDEYL
jgi:hypothetical protein